MRPLPLQPSGRSFIRALWLPVLIASTLVSFASELAVPVTPPLRVTSSGEFWTASAAVRDLPHELDLELTLTFYDPHWKLLWGVDRDGQSYWPVATPSAVLKPGQRVRLSGSVVPSLGLPLDSTQVTLLEDRVATPPLITTDQFADANRFNARLVTAEGFVNYQTETDPNHLELDLTIEGVPTRAYILLNNQSPIPQLSGAFVRLTGVYDANVLPQFHVNLWVARPDDLVVTGWLDTDPNFKLPHTPIEQLTTTGRSRVRVIGEVHSQKPGEEIIVRDDTGQLTIQTTLTRVVPPGERIEAVGIPLVRGIEISLRQAIFRVMSDPVPKSHSQGLPILRLADQVRQLPPESARQGYAVRLGGVVTWSHSATRIIYLHDASAGIAVTLPPDVPTPPLRGAAIRLAGHTIAGSFAPGVQAASIEAANQIQLLEPRPITVEQAMTGVEESQWVTLAGYAREVVRDGEWSRLHVSTPGGDFVAVVPHSPRIDKLEGAVIRVRGVCRAATDKDLHLIGIEVWAAEGSDIEIEEPSLTDPFVEPLRSVSSLRRFNPLGASSRRVRVAGVVLHHQPGAYLYLQEDQQSLMVLSRDTTPLQPGQRIEAVGFPGRQGSRLVLRESQYRSVGESAALSPLSIAAKVDPRLDGRLVRVEALVADVSPRGATLHLLCHSNGALFEAIGNREALALPAAVSPGSRIAFTGVYLAQFDQADRPVAFHLQLRTSRDFEVLSPAPWWTARRTRAALTVLAATIVFGLAWVLLLRRRVRRQTDRIRTELEKSSRLEAELMRSSKLESLGVLAGGIAHDFNNLLTVIIGNLSLVINDRRVVPEDEHFLREGERAAFRARDLTQQLLTFAKGGAPVRSAVLLPDIVREAAGFALHGSKVRCDFDFSSKLWPAHVDRGQISQVVHNIVLNAMHAMPMGGVLHVILRNETVSAGSAVPLQPGRFLKLTIRDGGTGISPEHLVRIFDPYFTTKQQGSGLGLATVYSIVKKHAGHIDVESQLGHGTTFHIWLPAAANAPETLELSSSAIPQFSGHALIMDDEAPVRDMAAAMLRRMGLTVTAVADGAQVVQACTAAHAAGRPFCVLILDLTVPGAMGGLEAMAALQKTHPSVRAIVSSGYSNDPVMAHFREHGFRGRVPKPYEFNQLAKVVSHVLAEPVPEISAPHPSIHDA